MLKMVLVDTISILPTSYTPEDYSCSIVGLADLLGWDKSLLVLDVYSGA